MISNEELADLLFPEVTETIEDLEKRFPPRNLPEGAEVTRFAPSPTGFLHTGSLFTEMIAYYVAKQSHGVFFFRLEDTDTKRTIPGAAKDLIDQLREFNLVHEEGYFPEGDVGAYGPYQQSKRADIYKVGIKHLLKIGRAYPDFCSSEDLEKIRKAQEESKVVPGYYGIYARDRNLTNDERAARIKAGEPWVIRFKSLSDHDRKMVFHDEIRGDLEIQENDIDVVIYKSDGLPTYHFAHVMDDHFMHTTLVSRGEEWIPSTPTHLELFSAFGWKAPKYAHLPVIMKLDHGNKRKLSKRKDPEAAVSFFLKEGYPVEGVKIYLMSIANSNFEEWCIANKKYTLDGFTFSFGKMSLDGALFDLDKLSYFSKEAIAGMDIDRFFAEVEDYAKKYNPELLARIDEDPSYFKKILNIERDRPNPRKDYAKFSDIVPATRFFFDDEYAKIKAAGLPFDEKFDKAFIKEYLDDIALNMAYGPDEATWWNSVKEISAKHGFATVNREYKANPEAFKGNMAAASSLIRVALTGSKDSPSMYEIISIIGKDRVAKRLQSALD